MKPSSTRDAVIMEKRKDREVAAQYEDILGLATWPSDRPNDSDLQM
jgi:hypothetical protein